jgi:hypothetical protein
MGERNANRVYFFRASEVTEDGRARDNMEELDRLNEELTLKIKELQEELDELIDELNQRELQVKKWKLYTYGALGISIICLLFIFLRRCAS